MKAYNARELGDGVEKAVALFQHTIPVFVWTY
jgi:hypothetical protein